MKIKPIKPSLKAKKRYLAFEIISKERIIDFNAVSAEIWAKATQFMGENMLSDAHMSILKDTWDAESQKGIIKINHTYVDKLKAALCLSESINKTPSIITTRGVSGILKKAKAKYIKSK